MLRTGAGADAVRGAVVGVLTAGLAALLGCALVAPADTEPTDLAADGDAVAVDRWLTLAGRRLAAVVPVGLADGLTLPAVGGVPLAMPPAATSASLGGTVKAWSALAAVAAKIALVIISEPKPSANSTEPHTTPIRAELSTRLGFNGMVWLRR